MRYRFEMTADDTSSLKHHHQAMQDAMTTGMPIEITLAGNDGMGSVVGPVLVKVLWLNFTANAHDGTSELQAELTDKGDQS